jgi:hypothetical protein
MDILYAWLEKHLSLKLYMTLPQMDLTGPVYGVGTMEATYKIRPLCSEIRYSFPGKSSSWPEFGSRITFIFQCVIFHL